MPKPKVQEVPHVSFDKKHRPRTLDRVIGQELAVRRLQGIIATKKYPSTMLFIGPSSAGKTTLPRAFAADMFGVKTIEGHSDFMELNASESRGIDDVRDMLRVSKLMPRTAPRRIILLDEAHGFTNDSVNLLLKPLEHPPAKTLFILGTMEPEKLKQAMKNRGSQFVLQAPSIEDITKYIKRIVKAEGMAYMTDKMVEQVAKNSNGEMRSAAFLLEAIMQAAGTQKKVDSSVIQQALSSATDNDDALAVQALYAVYQGRISAVYRTLLDVQNGFQFISKLLGMNRFLINNLVLNGERHRSVWWSDPNKRIHKLLKELFEVSQVKSPLLLLSVVQQELVELKRLSGAFQVSETDAVGFHLVRAIQTLKPHLKTTKDSK